VAEKMMAAGADMADIIAFAERMGWRGSSDNVRIRSDGDLAAVAEVTGMSTEEVLRAWGLLPPQPPVRNNDERKSA
jgi:hypothetical protein